MIKPLTNQIVLEKKIYKNIKYNTKISNPKNDDLVIVKNGEARRMSKLENNVINPSKKSIFDNFKIDHNEYVIYKVNNHYFEGTWGGNVIYLDDRFKQLDEKVFIVASYSFLIEQPEKFVILVPNDVSEYDSLSICKVINNLINNAVKNIILDALNKFGFIITQNTIINVCQAIETDVNDNILKTYGVTLTNFNIELEEDEAHIVKRQEYESKSRKTKMEATL